MSITLEKVFGISKDPILSYLERLRVDGHFSEALKSDKQIVVYGSSKQGKTALVEKHIPYAANIVVSLSPGMKIEDIYRSILKQLDITIVSSVETGRTTESELAVEMLVKAKLPLLAESEIKGIAGIHENQSTRTTSAPVEINVSLPNDIAPLINKYGKGKFIILENFHYLNDELQKKLAFDLRSFQELGVRFVILGVWREKNRLTQFNGDLVDRIVEVPVEPWDKAEFRDVINKGERYLNVKFNEEVVGRIIENAFDSIGVVQELTKEVCRLKNVLVPQAGLVHIEDASLVDKAISTKVEMYSSRHIRALESIAEGRKSTGTTKDGLVPLYMPYYAVRAVLGFDFDEVVLGIRRERLEAEMKRIHHRGEDIRPSDMTWLLNNLALLQSEKGIVPPIFDYDHSTRTIRVVDSTFYFFLRNVDRENVIENLNNPLESHKDAHSQLTIEIEGM